MKGNTANIIAKDGYGNMEDEVVTELVNTIEIN